MASSSALDLSFAKEFTESETIFLSSPVPLDNFSVPSFSFCTPSSSSTVPSDNFSLPSTILFIPLCNSFILSNKSSNLLKSKSSVIIFGVEYVNIFESSKFVASIEISKLSGISISLKSPLKSKLSSKPGINIPTTIVLSPSFTTFPDLETSTFLLFSESIIVPTATINGVYIVAVLPFIFIVFLDLLIYFILILTLPVFPANSSGVTSTPSNL